MKYLHDDNLSELTNVLTECSLGGAVSQRVLHGRIEAYTMKRGSDDKKYAFKLGEKYVQRLEQHLAEENANLQTHQRIRRKRSQSADLLSGSSSRVDEDYAGGSGLSSSATTTTVLGRSTTTSILEQPTKLVRRSRASSFDATRSQWRASQLQQQQSQVQAQQQAVRYNSVVPSALGDFAAQGTRRLMVRNERSSSSQTDWNELGTFLTFHSFPSPNQQTNHTTYSTHTHILTDGPHFDPKHEFPRL